MEREQLEFLIGFLLICTWSMKEVCGRCRKLDHGGGLICESTFKKIQKTGFYAYEFTHLMCEIDDNNTRHAILKRMKLGNIQYRLYEKENPGLKKGTKTGNYTGKYKGQHDDPGANDRESALLIDKKGRASKKKYEKRQTFEKFREEYRTLSKGKPEQPNQQKDTDKQRGQKKDKDKQPDQEKDKDKRPDQEKDKDKQLDQEKDKDKQPDQEKDKDKQSVQEKDKDKQPDQEKDKDKQPDQEKDKDKQPDQEKDKDKQPDQEKEKDKQPDQEKDKDKQPDQEKEKDKQPDQEKDKDKQPDQEKDKDKQPVQEKDKDKQPDQEKDKDKQPDQEKETVGYLGPRRGKEKHISNKKGMGENTTQKQDVQRLSFIVCTVSRRINILIRRSCIRQVKIPRVAKEGTGYIRLGSGKNAINVKRYDIKKSWDEALRFCRAEKASLVKIDTKQKMEQIKHILCKVNDKLAKFYMWIGLKDFNGTNVYKWLDGSPSEFTYWSKKDPSYMEHRSGVTVDADCVVLDNFVLDGVFWDDTYCGEVNGFICEKSLV